MSRDQDVNHALSDVKQMIGAGIDLADALTDIAAAYDLKPEVLRFRAEKAFGDLTTARQKFELARVRADRDHQLRLVYARYRSGWGLTTYPEEVPSAIFKRTVEHEHGFQTDAPDGSLAAETDRAAFYKRLAEILDQVTNSNAPYQ